MSAHIVLVEDVNGYCSEIILRKNSILCVKHIDDNIFEVTTSNKTYYCKFGNYTFDKDGNRIWGFTQDSEVILELLK